MRLKFATIIFGLAIVGADIIGYAAIGIALMGYDDNYDASKGAYGSWNSMTNFDRAAFATLYIWHALNIILLLWILRKLFKLLKTNRK